MILLLFFFKRRGFLSLFLLNFGRFAKTTQIGFLPISFHATRGHVTVLAYQKRDMLIFEGLQGSFWWIWFILNTHAPC